MKRFSRFAIAAAAAIVTASAAASAQDHVTRHVRVAYGDLDLTTADGQSVLRQRIISAAARACGGNAMFVGGYRDAPQFHDKAFVQCFEGARDDAMAALNSRGVRMATLH